MIKEIEPFFFPTTVGFVDDSKAFLANLVLQLDSKLAFRFFYSPRTALEAFQKPIGSAQNGISFLAPYHNRDEVSETHEVVAVSLTSIHKQVFDASRFNVMSVLVVDYEMPGMNGLEFCRQISNPDVKKIMLTGKANESVAIKSFNEGLIDRFIRKNDVNAICELNNAIKEMQSAYFKGAYRTICETLAFSDYMFLSDSVFVEKVREIFCQLGIVEYYLSYQPSGILMLDSKGAPYLLIVHTRETLSSVREIASTLGAPNQFLSELDAHRNIPHFWQTQGHYSPECSNWQSYMHPASILAGEQDYIYTVVVRPRDFNGDNFVSYDNYLNKLDEEMEATWSSST
ncbi:response regulator [Burkholderia diffusa]|uniref:response regulator n=1 Tax=Burkholderia diffusa TaxID=488732 RepID=UPI000754130F|nr:response regulator [Burkholderia diffusa]KVN02943.1 response regulator receiver protein [Burkholderia diffusa]